MRVTDVFRWLVPVVAVAVAVVAGAVLGSTSTERVGAFDDNQIVDSSVDNPPPAMVDLAPQPPVSTPPLRLRNCSVVLPESMASGVTVFAEVALAQSGEVLWRVEGGQSTIPASVLKLVTARAALNVLGPDYRLRTTIVEGARPGELWVVGGGDPTLSRTPPGSATYYPDPPRLSDLVDQVGAFTDQTELTITTLGVDVSRYDRFPMWNDTWRPNAAELGFVTPVTAFMVDGGRNDPVGRLSGRTSDPVGQASASLAELIGQRTGSWGVEVVSGIAPVGNRVIAEVMSQPVAVLIDQMIRDSDNQIAEALLREVAVVEEATSLDQAARLGLPENLRDSAEFRAEDGSGLSQNNRLSPELVTSILGSLIADDNGEIVLSSLAIPGQPGSLLRRETSFGDAAGDVSAKTGSLPGVRSLAGIIDGLEPLIFSVFVVGDRVSDDTRDDIDYLVSEFHRCGENLAHLVPTQEGG